MVHKSDQYMNDSHSPRRRLYEPEARAGFRHFRSLETLGTFEKAYRGNVE
jgi:hypothetical protein